MFREMMHMKYQVLFLYECEKKTKKKKQKKKTFRISYVTNFV